MASLTALVAILPKVIIDFVKGMVDVLAAIADLAPKVAESMLKIMEAMLAMVIKSAPKMALAAIALITAFLKVLNAKAPAIIQAGWNLLIAFLKGIDDNISEVVTTVGNIIVKFLTAAASQMPRIIASGATLLIKFLEGMAKTFPRIIKAGADMLVAFLRGIANNIERVVTQAGVVVVNFIKGITNKARDVVAQGGKLIARIVEGIGDALSDIVRAAGQIITKFISALAEEIPRIANSGAKAVVRFLDGMREAVDNNSDKIASATGKLLAAIGSAMVTGIPAMVSGFVSELTSQLGSAISKIPGAKTVAGIVGIHLPGKKKKSKTSTPKLPSIPKKAVDKGAVRAFHIGEETAQAYEDGFSDISGKAAVRMAKAVVQSASDAILVQFPNVLDPEVKIAPTVEIFDLDAAKDMLSIAITKMAPAPKIMEDIAKSIGNDFAKGLLGSEEDIVNAFENLNSQITEKMTSLNETIAADKERKKTLFGAQKTDVAALNRLETASHPDKKALKEATQRVRDDQKDIEEARKAIAANEKALETFTSAHNLLVSGLDSQKSQLIGLGKDYQDITATLEKAKSKLGELIKTRDDAVKSFSSQYATLPSLEKDGPNQLYKYEQSLQNQAAAVAAYQTTLEQLRQLGLDDQTYQKLLSEGTADQKFADQLLA
ncbi:MAG TPA: hypothetical protein VN843_02710, partial [Anaerolineales bacterium]|nr:hypothetical protein [Anaerolineales bacterium]